MTRWASILHGVVEYLRADDHGVADGNRRGAMRDVANFEFQTTQVSRQVHDAVIAKVGIGPSRGNIDGDKLFAQGGDKDSLLGAICPIFDTASLYRREIRWPCPITFWIIKPQFFTASCIQRYHLAMIRCRINTTADHQRRGAIVAGEIQKLFIDSIIGGFPAPGDFELGKVAGVNLTVGSVLCRSMVGAMMAPFTQ